MIENYEIEDGKCVVCGAESGDTPLCPICYKNYKRYYDFNENLNYCNKNIKFAMLKLFAHFDLLEEKELDSDKSSFLIDFAKMIRPIVEDEDFLHKKQEKVLIEELQKENEKLKKVMQKQISENEDDILDPRKKWPTKYRCSDGHYVRSRAELLIDNWLFDKRIIHIYERQVTFASNEKFLCDFYLPDFNAYVEFWGKTDDYYVKRRNIKTSLYKTLENVKLIELDDKALENLDDILENRINEIK